MLYNGAATCRRTCLIKVPCEGGEDYSRTSWAWIPPGPLVYVIAGCRVSGWFDAFARSAL